MGETYKFPCGCEVPILNEEINPHTGIPSLDIDFDKLPLECEGTWKLFQDGNTQGVFQVESKLGIDWSKEIKPENIEDCAAIGALLRPGPLNGLIVVENGDSVPMTKLYADRKNGKRVVTPIDDNIKSILETTYQVIVYQEQFMKIAQELAGFNLVQVDTLRKAAGKKDQALMTKVGEEFLEGCRNVGKVSDEKAKMIWDAIKTAGRYSFNKCLGLNTIVETPTGFKTLDEVVIGDKVLGPTKDGDKFLDVVNVYDNGEKELCEITLESGKTIECTLDHKFLCSDGNTYPLSEILLCNYLDIVTEDE